MPIGNQKFGIPRKYQYQLREGWDSSGRFVGVDDHLVA